MYVSCRVIRSCSGLNVLTFAVQLTCAVCAVPAMVAAALHSNCSTVGLQCTVSTKGHSGSTPKVCTGLWSCQLDAQLQKCWQQATNLSLTFHSRPQTATKHNSTRKLLHPDSTGSHTVEQCLKVVLCNGTRGHHALIPEVSPCTKEPTCTPPKHKFICMWHGVNLTLAALLCRMGPTLQTGERCRSKGL